MSIKIQYEAGLEEKKTNADLSQLLSRLSRKERDQVEKQRQRSKEFEEENPSLFRPWPDEYKSQHGSFLIDLAHLQSLVERYLARLENGDHLPFRGPHWRRDWDFTPIEFYNRVLARLRQVSSSDDFQWALFEPVYGRGFGGNRDVNWLVAGLLELGWCQAWCKACQVSYQVSELTVWDWSKNELCGNEYICPQNHLLLRTAVHFIGVQGTPYYHRQREGGLDI